MKIRQVKSLSTTQWSRQHGGTLLGFIVGLVIGLAIAVAVALLITKSSTPFTNKNAKSDKPETAVAPMQDPNKPMYGNKEPVLQAAKDLAKSSDSAHPALGSENKVDEKKPQSTVAPTDAKLLPKSDIKSDSTSKTELVDDKHVYFLQAGAFKENADAESTRAKLALLGFEAKINEKNSDSGVLYRVWLGPYSQLEVMNRSRARLLENGIEIAIVKTVK